MEAERSGAGQRQARRGDRPLVGHPELAERQRRRRFTAEHRRRVLREAHGCTKPGATDTLLRREGLYSSHLTALHKQREECALGALSKLRGRPAADPRDGDGDIARLLRRAEP